MAHQGRPRGRGDIGLGLHNGWNFDGEGHRALEYRSCVWGNGEEPFVERAWGWEEGLSARLRR